MPPNSGAVVRSVLFSASFAVMKSSWKARDSLLPPDTRAWLVVLLLFDLDNPLVVEAVSFPLRNSVRSGLWVSIGGGGLTPEGCWSIRSSRIRSAFLQ